MSKPPTNRGRKLSVEARAEMGHDRVCETCGDTKIVNETTFTPTNRGFRGWSTTCKVCQATEASGSVSKPGDLKTYRQHFERSVNQMYLEALKPKPNVNRLDTLCKAVSEEIKSKGHTEEGFRMFITAVKPLMANWMEPGAIHDDIIKGLLSQHRRRLVIATRYSAKSTLTCIYVAWRIFLDPLIKIMIVSRGSKLAARNLRTVRSVFIENAPFLRDLIPTDDCLDNAEQFQVPAALKVVTGGATLTSLGITSNLPGFRSDLTIGDDVEGPADNTPEKVEDLHEVLNELHMINPKGEKLMLGTYQSEYSIYAKMADLEDEEGTPIWELHRACMFEEDKLDGKLVIHSRWPAMFSDKDGMDWRRAVTERAWRLHAMLIADPTILNERPLKISSLILFDWSPGSSEFPLRIEAGGPKAPEVTTWSAPKGDEWYRQRDVSSERSPYVQTIMAVDPASGLAARDAIGVAVLSITQAGFGVIRHLEGVRGPDKLSNIRRCAEIAGHFNATQIVVEELADGLFGETLDGQLVTLGLSCGVEKVTTGGQQKGRRIIETLGPPISAGRIVMLEAVARSDHGGQFVNQLVRISYDGKTGKAKDHDDIVDALAHAVATAKHSLVSDISDNLSNFGIGRLDNLRDMPLRYGGLGVSEQSSHGRYQVFGDPGTSGHEDRPLAERLVEEDEVLIALEARKEHLEEVLRTDASMGRKQDTRILSKIITLRKQIKELRELQVL